MFARRGLPSSPASPEQGDDLVRAEPDALGEAHRHLQTLVPWRDDADSAL
jgi:hypothetical protein